MSGRLLRTTTLACLLAATVAVPTTSAAPATRPAAGHVTHGSYSNAAGTRHYRLFTPSSYHGQPLPLVVELPGCTESADIEAARSRFDLVAERMHFLVLYPEQDPAANGGLCWNWFLPADQQRGAGEPAILAGMTRWVQRRLHADRSRTYVMGISAGGAMTEVMAATYPDLFAAIGVYAGCAYRALPCAASVTAVPPQQSAQWVVEAGAGRAHVTPTFVIQGDADPVVPPPNSDAVVQEHLYVADLLAGRPAGALPYLPTSSSVAGKPGAGQGYTIDRWSTPRCPLVVRWTVHGMAHQWADSPADTGDPYRDPALNDPAGPDVTTAAAEFLLAHRLHAHECVGATMP